MKALFVALGGLFLAAVCAAPSQASVIFESVPDLSARPDVNNLCTSCGGRFQAYSGVRLEATAQITDINLVVRDFAGACCFYDDHLYVRVYDGSPDDQAASLIYEHRVFPYGSGHAPEDQLTSAPVRTDWETAILSFQTPGLTLLGNHDYTFSFVDNDFHIAVFRTGTSPSTSIKDRATGTASAISSPTTSPQETRTATVRRAFA